MRLRLEPADEYLHELGPEENFNESMYFNFYDPEQRLGGFCRLANRANEGKGEMTVCVYLPDGRVGFMFQRPEVRTNDTFDAGGMAFGVVDPFKHLTIRYDGKVVMLDEPLAMAEPRQAFTENPHDECTITLDYYGVGEMFGGEPEEQQERPGEEFAKGHYESLGRAVGTVKIGGEEWSVTGYGLRDHSWGPRYWQAPWYYRWLTGNVGDEFGFMGSRIARQDREGTRGGFVWDGETMHLCDDFRLSTAWVGDDSYHERIEARLTSGDNEWRMTGRVLNLIPLRNRRDGMVTRISEGMTEWTLEDGRVGYGLSEYLDQLVDNQPVGLAE